MTLTIIAIMLLIIIIMLVVIFHVMHVTLSRIMTTLNEIKGIQHCTHRAAQDLVELAMETSKQNIVLGTKTAEIWGTVKMMHIENSKEKSPTAKKATSKKHAKPRDP